MSGACHTLEEKYTRRYRQEKESNIMLKPVLDCALDAFIRGLPDDMSIFVDTRNPRDLSEAMEYALHIEERLDYTEKTRALASTFHATKRDGEFENRRPLSPYTTQMASTDKHEKVSHENSKMVTFEQNSTHPSSTVPQSTSYPQFPYWKNQGRPFPRLNSPGPAKDLNSKRTPGQDATSSLHSSERSNSNKFSENTIGSFEQGGTPKIPQ